MKKKKNSQNGDGALKPSHWIASKHQPLSSRISLSHLRHLRWCAVSRSGHPIDWIAQRQHRNLDPITPKNAEGTRCIFSPLPVPSSLYDLHRGGDRATHWRCLRGVLQNRHGRRRHCYCGREVLVQHAVELALPHQPESDVGLQTLRPHGHELVLRVRNTRRKSHG